ncbi:hypothetical protein KC356_g307 [Hortaea werneckii]|nr:hypothetical protein KC356_g307 [Hortaea werneckii]
MNGTDPKPVRTTAGTPPSSPHYSCVVSSLRPRLRRDRGGTGYYAGRTAVVSLVFVAAASAAVHGGCAGEHVGTRHGL